MSDTWVRIGVVTILVKEGADEDEVVRVAERVVDKAVQQAIKESPVGKNVRMVLVA